MGQTCPPILRPISSEIGTLRNEGEAHYVASEARSYGQRTHSDSTRDVRHSRRLRRDILLLAQRPDTRRGSNEAPDSIKQVRLEQVHSVYSHFGNANNDVSFIGALELDR